VSPCTISQPVKDLSLIAEQDNILVFGGRWFARTLCWLASTWNLVCPKFSQDYILNFLTVRASVPQRTANANKSWLCCETMSGGGDSSMIVSACHLEG